VSEEEFGKRLESLMEDAEREPVIMTSEDNKSYILLSIKEYKKLIARLATDTETVIDVLSCPEDSAEIELSIERDNGLAREVDFGIISQD